MVKIKFKILILSVAILMFLMNVAYAVNDSKLIFSDIDVKVGGRSSKNLEDGDTIDDEAEPGDTVEFKIEITNDFTDEDDLKIEDVSVDVTIEEIDDGDDLDDESTDFDLRPERHKSVTLKFQVPLEVEEDDFTVLIHAEGEDENGTDHEADVTLTLEVQKESHLLKITRNSLSPAEVSCNRKNIQYSTNVINIGTEDEDDVTLQVINSELGVDLTEQVDELTAEPNEDESRYSKVFSFNAPADAEAGSYPIVFRVLYNNDREKSEEQATLTVSDCSAKPSTVKTTGQVTQGAEESVEVITPPITPVTQPIIPTGTVVTQESFLKSNAFVVGIIIAEVVAVLVGIVLVVSLFRRRN